MAAEYDDDHRPPNNRTACANDRGAIDHDNDHGADDHDHGANDDHHTWGADNGHDGDRYEHHDHHRSNDDNDRGANHDDPDHDDHGLRAAEGMTMRARRSERGAVMVEAAITAPLLFMLIFGVIEMSLMLRDRVALDAVGHDAVRAAAISGNNQDADHHILEVVMDSASPIAEENNDKIVIFRADGPSTPVPAACLVGSQDGTEQCNRYIPLQYGEDLSKFGCKSDRNLDRFWCPSERVVAQSAATGGPPDYIGVYLEFERSMVTGFFGDSQTLRSTTILRIEPRDL